MYWKIVSSLSIEWNESVLFLQPDWDKEILNLFLVFTF